MIKEYDKVKIRKSGISGEVIDIYTVDGETRYTIESDKKIDGEWKLFRCSVEELEKL